MGYSTSEVAVSIVQTALGIHRLAWSNDTFNSELVEDLFFAELLALSDDTEELSLHPEAQEFIEGFTLPYIRWKVDKSGRLLDSQVNRGRFHALLDDQPEATRLELRRMAIYRMHCALMRRDFGDLWDSFSSECQGLTRDAEEFIAVSVDFVEPENYGSSEDEQGMLSFEEVDDIPKGRVEGRCREPEPTQRELPLSDEEVRLLRAFRSMSAPERSIFLKMLSGFVG